MIHAADMQFRDGAPLLLAGVVSCFPWLRCLFADGGNAGDKFCGGLHGIDKWTVQIVKRSD